MLQNSLFAQCMVWYLVMHMPYIKEGAEIRIIALQSKCNIKMPLLVLLCSARSGADKKETVKKIGVQSSGFHSLFLFYPGILPIPA